MTSDFVEKIEQESKALAEDAAEEFFHHDEHHKTKVLAFELYEQTVTAGGADYGPWFYWFTAQWKEGIIKDEPLPPPIE